MDEFQMIKSTLMSIKEYVSMISSFPNESDRNSVIRQTIHLLPYYLISFSVSLLDSVTL